MSEGLEPRKIKLVQQILSEEQTWAIEQLEREAAAIAEIHRSDQLVIGTRPNGDRVVKSRFIRRALQSIEDVERGEWQSLESLAQASDTW
jgi:hypothetical protein